MPIITFTYKRVTFLNINYTLTVTKRFSGNMPDKFSTLITNACKRGAGCAMTSKIVNSILNNKNEFIKNPIREPMFVSRNMITDLMFKKYKQDLDDVSVKLNKYSMNIKNMPLLLKEQTEKIRIAQYNNDIRTKKEAHIIKVSSSNIKDLHKAQNNLQKDKENATVKISKK